MGGVLGDLFGWRNVFFALLPALACPKGLGSPLYAGMSGTQTIPISLPAAISPAAETSA